jgi:predicted transcriptional regulator
MKAGRQGWYCSIKRATIDGMKKNPTSIRLSDEAKRLLALMAEKLAISQAAVIELAIREKAKREGIKSGDRS